VPCYKCSNSCSVVLSCNRKECIQYKYELLDLKYLPKHQTHDFNIRKHEDKIIINNRSKTVYNKQVIYTLDKRFKIHYSDFRSISTNFSGRKEAKILHRRLYSLNNNVSKWTFCNRQIAAVSYISLYHNYSTVTRAYLIHEYFNRVETQMAQCIDIKDLRVTTQRLV
jgi:hypothetical protein